MKFLFVTQESSSLFQHWDFPYGVQDILVPSHQILYLYSMLHNRLPRNGDPNIVFSIEEILFAGFAMSDLSISSPTHLYSLRVYTLHECEHDPYLLRPLVSEHFHYHISELLDLSYAFVDHPAKQDNGTSLPKQGELSYDLHCGSFFDIQPYCKSKTFIETKVDAMKLQGFKH